MIMRKLLAASLGTAAVFVLGCGADPAPDPPPLETGTPPLVQGHVETVRSTAFDANGRLFVSSPYFGAYTLVDSIPTLHVRYVEAFIQEPGFGGGRMVRMDSTPPSQWMELHPEDGDLPPVQPDKSPRRGSGRDIAGARPAYNRSGELLTYVDGTRKTVRESGWQVKERYLIGVTQADVGPRVYLHDAPSLHTTMKYSKSNPASESAMKSMSTRVADAFETEALASLRDGGEVMVNTKPHEMRIVGAIRARNECLSCHKVAAGELLGAFTYTLAPLVSSTPEADCLKDLDGLTAVEVTAVEAIQALGGKVTRDGTKPIATVQMAHDGRALTSLPAKNSALKHLAAFPELASLDLSRTLIDDAGIPEIVKRKHLKKLIVMNSMISQNGAAQLKKALPNCDVVGHSAPVLP